MPQIMCFSHYYCSDKGLRKDLGIKINDNFFIRFYVTHSIIITCLTKCLLFQCALNKAIIKVIKTYCLIYAWEKYISLNANL